jgi:GNAT superfamily N-acetyltransferase
VTDGSVDSLSVRPATSDDDPAVLELLRSSLGWQPSEYHADFFLWKHRRNPFGASPAWLACVDDQIVGYRTMMRWRFEQDGAQLDAVRAVDTATHPDHQGRGIFTKLTLAAIDDLRAQSVSFVFNTPNDKSRPGYLKMGWHEVGRVPISISPRRLSSLPKLARSMHPAEKWSEPTAVGLPAREALRDDSSLKDLLSSQPPPPAGALRTVRTPEYLAWRYEFPALEYRVVLRGRELADGFAVFRLRKRSAIVEATVCELLTPEADRQARAELFRRVRRSVDADAVVKVADGLYRLPRQGPMLTARPVNTVHLPARSGWKLSLGDVELF